MVVVPPASLLTCPDEPPIPEVVVDQDLHLAPLIGPLAIAGRGCREQLGRVREFVEDAKNRKP